MNRKPIEIRDLLAWTYREEMPKLERFTADEREDWFAEPAAWDAITRLSVLGCRVDTSGPAPDTRPLVYPHPDALLVNKAVMGFATWTIAMPDGWDALGDIEGLGDDERADAHRRGWDIAIPKGDRLGALVMRQAWLDRVPAWRDHGTIERRPMLGANGKPAWFRIVNAAGPGEAAQPREVDGFDAKSRRPHRGAYHKHYLHPCPSLLVAARIEYQAWALALHSLARDLQGTLSGFGVSCDVALWPWEGEGHAAVPRVLSVRPSGNASGASFEAA